MEIPIKVILTFSDFMRLQYNKSVYWEYISSILPMLHYGQLLHDLQQYNQSCLGRFLFLSFQQTLLRKAHTVSIVLFFFNQIRIVC